MTPATDYYNYRAFFETILTYGSDAAVSHLTDGFWYLDDGDLLPCDPTAEKRGLRCQVEQVEAQQGDPTVWQASQRHM